MSNMMLKDTQVEFAGYKCHAAVNKFVGGALAIQLYDIEDNSPVARATFNPEQPVPKNHVAVKVWSENEGMDKALINAGIIDPEPVAKVSLPYGNKAPVHKLTDDVIQLMKENY